MSQRTFQAAVARLVIEPDFRDSVRNGEPLAPANDLTELEQQRLVAIASDRGVDAARMLHESFRLSKIYKTLPLTRALLGRARLTREISEFWRERPPVSHYFFEEATAFCEFLQRRVQSGLRVKYLREVLTYERAHLELQRPRTDGERSPRPEVVNFSCDAEVLFEQLLRGVRPRNVPAMSCVLTGRLGKDGEPHWRVVKNAQG